MGVPAKQYLDGILSTGRRKPSIFHVTLADCPDFIGKLRECPEIYQDLCAWPMVVLGSYEGITLILEVKRI